jgi:hypothetical protein
MEGLANRVLRISVLQSSEKGVSGMLEERERMVLALLFPRPCFEYR